MRSVILSLVFCSHCFAGYSFNRTITIDHTKVPNTDQTDFPVAVAGTLSYLADVGHGGKAQSSSGFDVGFFTTSACTTKMDWETELYTNTNGTVAYWVRIPNLSHTVNTVFYLCYGNVAVTTDQSNRTAVWDSSFVSVLHLQSLTSDSTSNGLTMTNINAVTSTASGKIDGAGAFSCCNPLTDSYLTHATNAAYNNTNYTLSAWANAATLINGDRIASHGSTGDVPGQFVFFIDGATSKLSVDIPFVAGNVVSGGTTLTTSTYFHVSLTKNGNVYTVYLNGTSDGTATDATAPTVSGSYNVGAYVHGGINGFDGTLDEVRLSSSPRSADWLKTEYNNGVNPSAFYAIGPENGLPTIVQPRKVMIVGISQPPRITGSVGAGTSYNSQFGSNGRFSDHDTTEVAWCSNGNIYSTANDGIGPQGVLTSGRNVFLAQFSSDYMTETVVNSLDSLGTIAQDVYGNGTSIKSGGLWCKNGAMYMTIFQQDRFNFNGRMANIMKSLDNGATWCDPEHTNHSTGACTMSPSSTGMLPSVDSAMFPTATGIASLMAVQYCKDGSVDCPVVHNNTTYMYFLGTGLTLQNCYGMRTTVASLPKLDGSTYQYFKGGNFLDDARWSSNSDDKVDICMVPGGTDLPGQLMYIPQARAYFTIATTAYTPVVKNAFYTSDSPFGPWHLLASLPDNDTAWYAAVAQSFTLTGASSGTIDFISTGTSALRTDNPATNGYCPRWQTATIAWQ